MGPLSQEILDGILQKKSVKTNSLNTTFWGVPDEVVGELDSLHLGDGCRSFLELLRQLVGPTDHQVSHRQTALKLKYQREYV